MARPLLKTVRQFVERLNMNLPYDPASPLLGTYPSEFSLPSPPPNAAPVILPLMFFSCLFTHFLDPQGKRLKENAWRHALITNKEALRKS